MFVFMLLSVFDSFCFFLLLHSWLEFVLQDPFSFGWHLHSCILSFVTHFHDWYSLCGWSLSFNWFIVFCSIHVSLFIDCFRMNCGWKDDLWKITQESLPFSYLGKWPLFVYLMNWRESFTGKEFILISNWKQHLCHLSSSSKFSQ